MRERDLNPNPGRFWSAFSIWEFCPDQNLESTDEMPHGIDNEGNGDYDTYRDPDQGANETQ